MLPVNSSCLLLNRHLLNTYKILSLPTRSCVGFGKPTSMYSERELKTESVTLTMESGYQLEVLQEVVYGGYEGLLGGSGA